LIEIHWFPYIAVYPQIIALHDVLLRKGLDSCLPDPIREYFQAVFSLNLERNERLRASLVEAVGALNRIGVEPLLLKGAAVLHGEPYAGVTARMLGDLDILVPAASIPSLVA